MSWPVCPLTPPGRGVAGVFNPIQTSILSFITLQIELAVGIPDHDWYYKLQCCALIFSGEYYKIMLVYNVLPEYCIQLWMTCLINEPLYFKICLNVFGKPDQMTAFDELFDMEEQGLLREDCQALVGQLFDM